MSEASSKIARSIERVVDEKVSKALRRMPKSVTAEVVGRDGEDVIWVKLPGAEEPTPVHRSAVQVKAGDMVMATVGNGRVVIDSNVSDPSVGVQIVTETRKEASAAMTKAGVASKAATAASDSATAAAEQSTKASEHANNAMYSADVAAQAAQGAQDSAQTAAQAAHDAESSASNAALSAENAASDASRASTAATNALDQLGVVQDVVGVLNYVAQHGGFVRTEDQEIQEGKVYFAYDSSTGDYSPVIEPQASALSTYYEISEDYDDVMGDFIMTHLAVTQRGLWVLPSGMGNASDGQYAPGYKMLLASNGSYIYDGSGAIVRSDTQDGTNFASGRDWHMGGNDAYIFYDASEGTVTIGGSAVRLGDSRTLSELMAAVDGTIVFKVAEDYSADHSTATLTAHVYSGGEDVASQYAGSCFAWYRKDESGTSQDSTVPMVPLGNGRTITVARSTVGFGAAIVCRFTPPNDSVLLDGDDDTLTDSEGTPIAGRTPSGDYVRVADLEATTTVFDADRLMLVGSEGESLVSIATLKDVFGDGDYERLDNKPSIESVTLVDDKSFTDLGIFRTDQQGYDVPDDYTLSTMDINALWAAAIPIGG